MTTFADMTTSTVEAAHVTMRFGRTEALAGVSFSLRPGVTGLLGPNGAGKTTLLRILATAILPDTGRLSLLGHDPRDAPGRLQARRQLGYMPQEPGFHPSFTVFDFVDYVAILKELSDRRSRHAEVARVISLVGLDAQRGRRLKALSGGMRRRVALAAALVSDPQFLILDEPTVGLDPEQRLRFREFVADLGEHRTVLLSTHQTEDVMTLCHRVVVLHEGGIRFEGPPAELARQAYGRVWLSDTRPVGAMASWRTTGGQYRNIGDPPPAAHLLEPSIEDGYLLMLDGAVPRKATA